MRIYNPTYKKIAINWDSVELPVNEGTPFSASGTIANTSDAIGLLPVYIWKKPIDEEVYILIGGDVYQSEVEEAFGAELTDDAIASMGGINFYEADGTIDKESGGGGGTGALIIHYDSGTSQLDKTFKEISDAIVAGTPVILFYIDGDMVTHNYCFSVYAGEGIYQVTFGGVYRTSQGTSEAFAWVFSADSENDYPVED